MNSGNIEMKLNLGKYFTIGLAVQLLLGASFYAFSGFYMFTVNVGPFWFQWHWDPVLEEMKRSAKERKEHEEN